MCIGVYSPIHFVCNGVYSPITLKKCSALVENLISKIYILCSWWVSHISSFVSYGANIMKSSESAKLNFKKGKLFKFPLLGYCQPYFHVPLLSAIIFSASSSAVVFFVISTEIVFFSSFFVSSSKPMTSIWFFFFSR